MQARAVELLGGGGGGGGGGAEEVAVAAFPLGEVPDLGFLDGAAGNADDAGNDGATDDAAAANDPTLPSEAELVRFRQWSQGHIPRDQQHMRFGESRFEQVSRLHNARTHAQEVRDRAALQQEERQARHEETDRRSRHVSMRKADEMAQVLHHVASHHAFGQLKGSPRFQHG